MFALCTNLPAIGTPQTLTVAGELVLTLAIGLDRRHG